MDLVRALALALQQKGFWLVLFGVGGLVASVAALSPLGDELSEGMHDKWLNASFISLGVITFGVLLMIYERKTRPKRGRHKAVVPPGGDERWS